MKKISILSLHLGYGGIEKSVVNLANILSEEYEVEIISTYKLYNDCPFKINDNVKVKYLITKYKPNREEWKNALKKFRLLKLIKETYISLVVLFLRRNKTINAIKESDSDIIISTRILFNNWLGKYKQGKTYKVGWEHNHHHGDIKYINKLVNSCRNLDSLVLVSDSLRSFYKKEIKNKNYKCKCVFIPNFLDNVPDNVSNLKSNRLVSVGRMSKEKAFPDLIDVFKMVHDVNNDLVLDIVGDGAQKNMVIDKIYEYNLTDYVRFHGYQNKEYIDNLLHESSLYLMSSYTESFGIVLIEAMSHGIPCLAFTSAEGANDIIKNGENGYLISERDKERMAEKILEVMSDIKLRKRLGNKARKDSLKYTKDIVKKEWLLLLKKR